MKTRKQFVRDLGALLMLPTAEEVIADLTEREHAVIARQRRPVQVLALTGPPQAGQPMLVFAGG